MTFIGRKYSQGLGGMNTIDLEHEISRVGSFKAVRSQGPGGQSVNTTSSKIQLRLNLDKLNSLSDQQKQRVRSFLEKRIRTNSDGEYLIHIQNERSQLRNKEAAIHILATLIMKGLTPPKRRKPSRPTQAARRRRVEHKRAHSRKKSMRKQVDPDAT
jgi:ribosome-associated protein